MQLIILSTFFLSIAWALVTVDNFPATESHFKPVKHQVSVSSVPQNGSAFICYDFQTCQVISSRVTTRQKR